jgi:hypothetical protein
MYEDQEHDEQYEIQDDHLNGLHFGSPEPDCWICWDEDDEPECPGDGT